MTGTPVAEPLTRQVLLGPAAKRRLLLGDVNDLPDKKALMATCGPCRICRQSARRQVPRQAAGQRRRGKVSIRKSARNRGIEGSTVVRYWVPPSPTWPPTPKSPRSSGDASLDDAAIATVRSGKFSSECDYGLSSIRIAFKLQE